MYKRISLRVLTLFVSCFVAVTVSSGQNSSAQSPDNAHTRHSIAINLLRAINTSEVVYKQKNGRFADWDALLENEEFSGRAMQWAARSDPQLTGARLSKAPDVLPGWRLRMNVHADGQGYDVGLEDETDKACGYAALTDERAVIRQSKAIDCEI